ncbi:hypothetical protein BJX96DRAFT_171226 [Aspergillus floccosus]
MKISLVTLAALIAAAAAAPAATLPEISDVSQITAVLKGSHSSSSYGGVHAISPGSGKGLTGDVGHSLNKVLAVTGPDAKELLIELSPEVEDLLTKLSLGAVGKPVGKVIRTAANVGDLLKDLGGPVEDLLTVVGKDVGALLIQLSPDVKGLLGGLGLPALGVSIGDVVATLGGALSGTGRFTIRGDITATANVNNEVNFAKFGIPEDVAREHHITVPDASKFGSLPVIHRDGNYLKTADGKILCDLGSGVNNLLTILGPDGETLLVQVGDEVANLLDGLGLGVLGEPVGKIVGAVGGLLGSLLPQLGDVVEGLLCGLSSDLGNLLVELDPTLKQLLSGLGLASLAELGSVVGVLGQNI